MNSMYVITLEPRNRPSCPPISAKMKIRNGMIYYISPEDLFTIIASHSDIKIIIEINSKNLYYVFYSIEMK